LFLLEQCRTATRLAFFNEGDEKAEAIRTLEDVIGRVDAELEGKKFFGGENIGYLDLAIGWLAFWLGVAEEVACFEVLDSQKFPNIAAWIENFLQVPVIKENLPPRDKTVEFFRSYREVHLAASK